jgi:hypothetical protein
MADDSKEYSVLSGGIQLQVESSSSESGTLGCLAETNRPGEARRIVMLSVAHLLYAGKDSGQLGAITQTGARACHPDACSKCSTCCSDDVGRSLRGEFTQEVDAAIATLYAGTKYFREVLEIGPIQGVHDVNRLEAHNRARPFRVRKRGIRTRLTEGTVRLLDFVMRVTGTGGEFGRTAIRQMLIQPRTLVQAPIDSLATNGVIRCSTARFQTNGVTTNHFVEVSSPLNRGLYKIFSVRSETELVLANPRNRDFPAELRAETPGPLTAIEEFFEAQDPLDLNSRHGIRGAGLEANNPNLLPFDMVEISDSTLNNGIFQVQPVQNRAIALDFLAVYEEIRLEPPGNARIRGLPFARVRDELFCDASDSGAVLLNDNQEVVGLLAGRVERSVRAELSGYGFATPIDRVTNTLGINILTPANPGQEFIVAAAEAEPGSPGGPVARAVAPLHREQREFLRGAQQDLLATEGGRQFAELFLRHVNEVQNLLNTNKRVAVAWQRNGGPLLAQVALNAVQNPNVSIPEHINGLPLRQCLHNILDILEKYGSDELKLDVFRSRSSWTQLVGMSFNQVMNGLANAPNNMFG